MHTSSFSEARTQSVNAGVRKRKKAAVGCTRAIPHPLPHAARWPHIEAKRRRMRRGAGAATLRGPVAAPLLREGHTTPEETLPVGRRRNAITARRESATGHCSYRRTGNARLAFAGG